MRTHQPQDLVAAVAQTADPDPAWRQSAGCRSLPAEWFFPKVFDQPHPAALDACRKCPVRVECLADAVSVNDIGIRGGLTESERKTLRRRLRKAGVTYRAGACQWCSHRFFLPEGVDNRKFCPPPALCAPLADYARAVGKRAARTGVPVGVVGVLDGRWRAS